jgi:hypothetical protein
MPKKIQKIKQLKVSDIPEIREKLLREQKGFVLFVFKR